ncbi:hypothetical protein Tco_0110721 [Tanacetum coccineum]
MLSHGFPSGYVKLYDKHEGSFIVNGYRVKLYHDEEQLNELTSEEIHLMCEEGKMKAIPFMVPFPSDYYKTMPWVAEKPFIYSIVENTCNKAKLYDLDETGKGIVKGNFLYVKRDSSEEFTSPADDSNMMIVDRRRSLTGYAFIVGGCAISWKASLQATTALSTTEAEYMAISEACKEAIWLRNLFNKLSRFTSCTTIFGDSQSVLGPNNHFTSP